MKIEFFRGDLLDISVLLRYSKAVMECLYRICQSLLKCIRILTLAPQIIISYSMGKIWNKNLNTQLKKLKFKSMKIPKIFPNHTQYL